jgi:hypothetical protein
MLVETMMAERRSSLGRTFGNDTMLLKIENQEVERAATSNIISAIEAHSTKQS